MVERQHGILVGNGVRAWMKNMYGVIKILVIDLFFPFMKVWATHLGGTFSSFFFISVSFFFFLLLFVFRFWSKRREIDGKVLCIMWTRGEWIEYKREKGKKVKKKERRTNKKKILFSNYKISVWQVLPDIDRGVSLSSVFICILSVRSLFSFYLSFYRCESMVTIIIIYTPSII